MINLEVLKRNEILTHESACHTLGVCYRVSFVQVHKCVGKIGIEPIFESDTSWTVLSRHPKKRAPSIEDNFWWLWWGTYSDEPRILHLTYWLITSIKLSKMASLAPSCDLLYSHEEWVGYNYILNDKAITFAFFLRPSTRSLGWLLRGLALQCWTTTKHKLLFDNIIITA